MCAPGDNPKNAFGGLTWSLDSDFWIKQRYVFYIKQYTHVTKRMCYYGNYRCGSDDGNYNGGY